MTIRTSYLYQTLQIRTSDARLMLALWAVYVLLDREHRMAHAYGLVSIKRGVVPIPVEIEVAVQAGRTNKWGSGARPG